MIMMIYVIENLLEFQNDFIIEDVIENIDKVTNICQGNLDLFSSLYLVSITRWYRKTTCINSDLVSESWCKENLIKDIRKQKE